MHILPLNFRYVLENGGVAESGNHHELINRGGRYAELWKSQHRYGVEPKKDSRSVSEEERLLFELEQCCGNNSCNR